MCHFANDKVPCKRHTSLWQASMTSHGYWFVWWRVVYQNK